MPAFLVPLDAGLCLIPLEKAIVLIGRQSDCDVSLTHSRKISRKHCCIAQVFDSYIVRDLGSTNGIFINGNRVTREARLNLGDELVIGDVRFRIQSEAPSTTKTDGAINASVPLQTLPDQAAIQRPELPATQRPGTPPPIPLRKNVPPPSMDMPIPIPDMGQDFAVEPSIVGLRPVALSRPFNDSHLPISEQRPKDDVIPLASDSF